jgi:plasmid stabilization system protein ParE
MSYRVRLLKRADADVDTIYVWLARRSVQGAVNWYVAGA